MYVFFSNKHNKPISGIFTVRRFVIKSSNRKVKVPIVIYITSIINRFFEKNVSHASYELALTFFFIFL